MRRHAAIELPGGQREVIAAQRPAQQRAANVEHAHGQEEASDAVQRSDDALLVRKVKADHWHLPRILEERARR